MTDTFASRIQPARDAAIAAATAILEIRGFTPQNDGWVGGLKLEDGSTWTLKVVLPTDFPDRLPEVYVLSKFTGPIAHIEKTGKICIAPEDGILIDAERPADVLVQALERASDVLIRRDDATQTAEIESEFLAYWSEIYGSDVLSICPPDTPTGPIYVGHIELNRSTVLIAPSKITAENWCKAVGCVISKPPEAFFIQLDALPSPPRFDDQLSLRQGLELLASHTSAANMSALRKWLQEAKLPAWIVFSAKQAAGGDVVSAIYVPELPKKARNQLHKGFRKGRVPPGLAAKRAMGESVQRFGVLRGDTAYVMPRGGADMSLLQKTVTVVGCGSVGSHIAQSLAESGIGGLRLVDPEPLMAANIHRHVLGAADIRKLKVEGIAQAIRSRFPHISVTSHPKDVEAALEDAGDEILSSDVIVIAIGNGTTERRLNEFLHGKVLRIHVWLEPLGVGGHVLSLPANSKGCFHCLYRRDEHHGLTNMASFVAPGQTFDRSLDGCAGTFTPYGALDAQQAAIHACREAIRVLRDDPPDSSLRSWVVSKKPLTDSGLQLSTRGLQTNEGECRLELDFARPDCPVCNMIP